MENLGCGRNKALNLIKQLEEYDLIERKKLGQGKNSIVYVKWFVRDYVEEEISSTDEKKEVQKFENQTSRENHMDSEVYNLNIKKFIFQTLIILILIILNILIQILI